MANHDPHHSSKQRTILWTIAPVAVALTLLLTSLNHNAPKHREVLSGKIDMKKVAAPKQVAHEVNVHLVKDTTVVRINQDTLKHKAAPAPAHAH